MELTVHRSSIFLMFRFVAAGIMLSLASIACAQSAPPSSASDITGAFTLLRPGTLNLVVFTGGYISGDYGTTEEGVQLEQSVTRNIGLIARATGYQLYIGSGFDNPLNPGTGHNARYNFARLQGGLDFQLYDGAYLQILGGRDVADSNAASVEGDFSSWFLRQAKHPINLAASSVFATENGVVSSEIDLRSIAYATDSYTLFAGGGGAIYAAGFIHGIAGQGGPIAGLYWPKWRIGFDMQAGYGSAKEYGELSVYKQIGWTE